MSNLFSWSWANMNDREKLFHLADQRQIWMPGSCIVRDKIRQHGNVQFQSLFNSHTLTLVRIRSTYIMKTMDITGHAKMAYHGSFFLKNFEIFISEGEVNLELYDCYLANIEDVDTDFHKRYRALF